jgi:Na+-transporting NADH:ubiquinone oxidoreductase subunit C
MPRDSVAQTFKVALLLCVVCSILVSSFAVGLRPLQEANRALEMKKNILSAAGLFDPQEHQDEDVPRLFEQVEAKLVDLSTGKYTSVPENYDQRKASRDPKLSDIIPGDRDPATLKRREKYSFVYLVKTSDGTLDQIVLPIRGYGLWSTLWGFLSIDAATLEQEAAETTIRGLTFYEHKETPGLGGEVDNPDWKAKWNGRENTKKIFDAEWNVLIEVIKGSVSPNDSAREYKVDGLSGATITSRGVTKMLRYWLGDDGFGPYLQMLQNRLRAQGDGDG